MLIQTQRNGHTKQTHAHNKDKYREHRYIYIVMQYITNIKVENYRICFNDSGFVPNMSTSLQTTLAAEAHLAEGQFLLEEQTMNIEKSLI
jgi:hypothetical protein